MVQFRTLPPFGGDQRQVAEVVRGIMDGKTNNTGTLTLDTSWAITTTLYDERIGYDSIIFLFPSSDSAEVDTAPYGSFYDMTTQTAASANTAYATTYNTTDISNGVYISNSSRINVRNAGVYNLQFSAQFVNADSQIHDVDIWIRKNGTNIADTNGQLSVPNSHGGVNGRALPAWNYFISMSAGDYVEVMWNTNDTAISMEYIAAQSSPTRPATPSMITTMQYVAPFSMNNVYVSAQTRGQATISHFANNTAGKTYKYIIVG